MGGRRGWGGRGPRRERERIEEKREIGEEKEGAGGVVGAGGGAAGGVGGTLGKLGGRRGRAGGVPEVREWGRAEVGVGRGWVAGVGAVASDDGKVAGAGEDLGWEE
ncbi:hypothetical protein TIFTF001_034402 [Ficus carica]|uniref:Uncharacterized protein n=1 Tax=Ficus carica TaxID=3494 RepID=A0AA88J930_FICCA|nr:hypothetical protein TIFTF001_034402 [Ficus carica]